MGGWGSGGHYGGRETTSDYRSIDIRKWQREKLLDPPQSFSWDWYRNNEKVGSIGVESQIDRIILKYRQRSPGKDWTEEKYAVILDWTPCHFGGHRAWFLCPARDCGRRVAKLYSSRYFICRHCLDLAYECQRETDYDRAGRRADKIRERLDWMPGLLNGEGFKPKGMHWKTYRRLAEEHEYHVNRCLAGAALRFGISF